MERNDIFKCLKALLAVQNDSDNWSNITAAVEHNNL